MDPTHRYHFVAIGGIGMSAIARILLARGYTVSGSDMRDSAILTRLAAQGATVYVGHDAGHVQPGDVVVLSDAIKPDNPEWQRARELGLRIVKRADLLGEITNSARGIAVSGTHGKTTTSGMLALILLEAGLDPTCLLGGDLVPLGGNARPGGPLTVVEACEAYASFLNLQPEAALVTNVEVDHLDFHGTPEHLFEAFRQFLRQVRGFAVLNGDDALLQTMRDLPPRAVTYGMAAGNDYRCCEVRLGAEPSFQLVHGDEDLGTFTLRVPGRHNVSNAAGAAALARELGADPAAIRRALAAFPGMHRRFERIGRMAEVAIIDDYAHHPTELRATLTAAREAFGGRVIAVFQPHLFSRTRDLLEEFAAALAAGADMIIIPPIYAAREAPIPGVTHSRLVARVRALAPEKPVREVASLEEATALLRGAGAARPDALPPLLPGDVILTMGAGNVDSVAHALVPEAPSASQPAH